MNAPFIDKNIKLKVVETLPHCASLLESRHTVMLEWIGPWPACGPEGNIVNAMVTMRATVHDCINLQRAVDKREGRPTIGDDASRLEEFMVINWATVVEDRRR